MQVAEGAAQLWAWEIRVCSEHSQANLILLGSTSLDPWFWTGLRVASSRRVLVCLPGLLGYSWYLERSVNVTQEI